MDKKIQYLKNLFSQNDYELNFDDIKDLKIQLKRKPMQIYLLAIKWLVKKELLVTYENVREIIKNDIKIRNNIRNIITSLEESIRVQYLDTEVQAYDDFDQFYKKSKDNFRDILTKIDKLDLDYVRELRNDVNHLVYFLIFDKLNDAINKLKNLREWEHINTWVLDKYLDSIYELKNRCENLPISYKINFFQIFVKPFNWTNKNKKIAEINQFKESNKKSFINDIFESFLYLNNLYEEISFKQNINIIDFVISSIIFDSLVEKIREIDTRFSSKILEMCDFGEIIKKNFKTEAENNLEKTSHTLDKAFFERYIGKINHEIKDNYELLFLKGVRNKLIHPNGKNYNKTHMYFIGTHKESQSAWFPFGECSFVESIENRSPTFFIKKSIFVESIQKISEVFLKKMDISLALYIETNAKKNKPSLNLVNISEARKLYNKYFEDWEEIYLLFIWSFEKEDNHILIEYLIMAYTIAKFMNKSNNIKYDWKSWILPSIDKDIDNLMQKCKFDMSSNNHKYLKSKMSEENWKESEWLGCFGKEQSDIFLEMYKKTQIKNYKPKDIEEKFLIVIFHNKTKKEWLFLLKKLNQKYEKLIHDLNLKSQDCTIFLEK